MGGWFLLQSVMPVIAKPGDVEWSLLGEYLAVRQVIQVDGIGLF